jgi:hypothetical protein
MLAADPPVRAVIPKLFESAANLFVPRHFFLPQVIEQRVLRAILQNAFGIAGINRPGVFREKLHDVEAVFRGKLCDGIGPGDVSLVEQKLNLNYRRAGRSARTLPDGDRMRGRASLRDVRGRL